MNQRQIERAALGLYRVFWTSGGSSLAAIGQNESGDKWIAPTNWLAPGVIKTVPKPANADGSGVYAEDILRLERIYQVVEAT